MFIAFKKVAAVSASISFLLSKQNKKFWLLFFFITNYTLRMETYDRASSTLLPKGASQLSIFMLFREEIISAVSLKRVSVWEAVFALKIKFF